MGEISEVSGTTVFTYNAHGALATRTDARGITETRPKRVPSTYFGRVTFIDYPDDSLDISYTYDDVAVPFSLGRLTSIARNGHAVDRTYDRFGRQLQDGELSYGYDKNGNRTEVRYPDGVMALYTYDYADRQATLAVTHPSEPDETVVTSARYEPSGPLASLSLGNGLTEERGFDTRFYPSSIVVSNGATPVFDWQYSTDAEGNITGILDGLDAANHRMFGYQDYQYFLTQGDGPWGDLSWTYDKIGNRLGETRDGVLDTYVYVPNSSGGNSAQLQEIQLGAGGIRTYGYDLAGNQDQVGISGDLVDRTYDDVGRMSRQESSEATTDFLYDGRDFLRRASVGQDFSGAQDAGVLLRLPGQWTHSAWGGPLLSYNVHRWFDPSTARYTRPDPFMAPRDQHIYLYGEGRPLFLVDPLGLRALVFTGCEVWFLDDDYEIIQKCSAGSGVPGSTIDMQGVRNQGPIPEGKYYVNPREFTGGLRSLGRVAGWGWWRAPLRPAPQTETFERDGFFIHGDTRENRPDSKGCIDIGSCDGFAREWAMEKPSALIPLYVHYIGKVCN